MDQNAVIVSLVGSVTVIVGIVALLVKSFLLDKPKANGNGTKQSRDCWEQHKEILAKLDQVQKTLDNRQEVFNRMQDKLDDMNLTLHSK